MRNKKMYIFFAIMIIAIVIVIAMVVVKKNQKEEKSLGYKENLNTVQNTQRTENPDYVIEAVKGIELNRGDKLNEEKKLGDLIINNIQLTQKDGITTLIADVKNTGTSKSKLKNVKIKLLDKDGKVLTSLNGIIPETEPGKQTKLNVSMTSDFVDAYDFSIEEK